MAKKKDAAERTMIAQVIGVTGDLTQGSEYKFWWGTTKQPPQSVTFAVGDYVEIEFEKKLTESPPAQNTIKAMKAFQHKGKTAQTAEGAHKP